MKYTKEIFFTGKEPSIAYTDFSAVYFSTSLSGDFLDVARKHELSHIWLQHLQRAKNLLIKKKKINNYLWNVACDMEIAKHIYEDEDEDIINRPRSLLMGGITKKHTQKYPNCIYAEDFYEELLKSKEKFKSIDADGNKKIEVKKGEKKVKVKIPKFKEIKKELQIQKQEIYVKKEIKKFSPPKPSLASEIDRRFGRSKRIIVSSYRRPNKRESDFIQKGKITKPKSPKITIYVDRSGSFSPDKTIKATEKLQKILKKYRSKLKSDTIFFNDNLISVDPMTGNGGTNYQCVIDNIIKDWSNLSIIITDDDSAEGVVSPNKLPDIIIIPIGCQSTQLAKKIKSKEIND